jgi:hypothetical protein
MQAGLIAAGVLAAMLVVFSVQPTTARAFREIGEMACGLVAGLGAYRWLLRAERGRIRTTIRLSLGVFITSLLAAIGLGIFMVTTADTAASWDAATWGDGWLPALLDVARNASLGVLAGALGARAEQRRYQS